MHSLLQISNDSSLFYLFFKGSHQSVERLSGLVEDSWHGLPLSNYLKIKDIILLRGQIQIRHYIYTVNLVNATPPLLISAAFEEGVIFET